MRICILSKDNEPIGFLDNEISEGFHFYDDSLHVYFTGTAHTFEFSVLACEETAELLSVGNKISFFYKDRPYYMSIMTTEQDEEEIKVEAWAYCLELLNERASTYEPAEAHTFLEYFNTMIFTNDMFEIGTNEVSTYKRKVAFSNDTDTLLARIYSLATNFDAEIEFIPKLNDDYSLDKFYMNVFKAHSDTEQGIGERREDAYFRYGKDVDGITKKQDITDLYTMIVPYGKDGLSIASIGERKVNDEDGNLLYWHPDKSAAIYAPVACQNFPSAVTSKDKYIRYDWDTEYSTVETLYGNALAKLKELSAPESTYEIEGNIDVNVGDTITVIDEAFSPPLYLETRVTEQEISFTDPTRGKATFSNTKELENQIDSSLLKIKNEFGRSVVCTASVSNGIVFKNGEGETTLTAHVYEDGIDLLQADLSEEDAYHVNWYNASDDSLRLADSISITITPADLENNTLSLYYRVGRYISGSTKLSFLKGAYAVTLTNVNDGDNGEDAILLTIDSSNGNLFKNTNISTSLVVNITVAGETITSSNRMYEVFGENAAIKWKCRKYQSEIIEDIAADDPRLSDSGFIFTISPSDVDTKMVFFCELDF